MKKQISQVAEFCKKVNCPIGITDKHKHKLALVAKDLAEDAEFLEAQLDGDAAILRAHLMCEELSETILAIATGNNEEILDGLCDLLYVVFGTVIAVGYENVIEEAFDRVHKSNMSKTPSGFRHRDKGNSYQPPNLGELL